MIELNFSNENGLIPAIAQDYQTGEVLMVAYVNQEAWEESLRSNHATYYSRSRKKLWKKGESSGNVQEIQEILVDCDMDTIIYKVKQIGGVACHTGCRSCFYRKVNGNELEEIATPIVDPEKLYGTK